MNKAKKSVIAFSIISALIIIALFTISLQSGKPTIPDNKIVFYYSITCPHCKNVEDFMEKNNILNTLNIEEKEVYLNKENADELIKIGKQCNIQKDYIGAVPLIYYNKECLLGDDSIINFLKQKLSEAKQ